MREEVREEVRAERCGTALGSGRGGRSVVTAERGGPGTGGEPGAVRGEGAHQPRLRWLHGRGERGERQREGRPLKPGAPRVSSAEDAGAFWQLPILVRPARRDTRPQVEQCSGPGAALTRTHPLPQAQACALHMPEGRVKPQ